eukprot:TRINITY_DN8245_c0_g1_i4.p1 TRINITY_DN8245_c0_g1~~TRINITY_DN8245_c0_g1_i4.p1  ORF type:complete len:759 (-),score=105.27 TRINITY_DN8245_c0_g1_i4:87-2324(-)
MCIRDRWYQRRVHGDSKRKNKKKRDTMNKVNRQFISGSPKGEGEQKELLQCNCTQYSNELREIDAQMQRMKEGQRNDREKIKSLENEVELRKAEVRKLGYVIEKKVTLIKTMQEANANLARNEKELGLNQSELKKLRELLAERDHQIKMMQDFEQKKQAAADQQIADYENQLTKERIRIESLEKNAKDREEKLVESVKELDQSRQMISDLQTRLLNSEKELKSLYDRLGNVDETLSREKAVHESVIEELNQKVKIAEDISHVFNPVINPDLISKYDLVVKVTTLSDLSSHGWVVEEGEKYKETSGQEAIVAAVAGLANKGKTFITNKLCNEFFPSGFHVKTEGLSLKCGTKEGRVIFVLDSMGYQTPVQLYDENGRVDKNSSIALNEEEVCKIKINERNAVEDFLQSFLLETCNIVIFVVAQLTYSDQKLLSRITEKFKNKKVIIIHNLYDLCYITDVEKCIKTDILGAFRVAEKPMVTEQTSKNSRMWVAIRTTQDTEPVRHLVMAREGTEAGEFFNDTCFEHVRNVLAADAQYQQYNLLKALSTFAEATLHDYAEMTPGDKSKYILEYNEKSKSIKLTNGEKFTVKQVSYDARGELMKVERSNEFRPAYSVVNYPEKLEILIDIPGDLEKIPTISFDRKRMNQTDNNMQYIQLEGKRCLDKQIRDGGTVLHSNRREGEIDISIPLIPLDQNSNLLAEISKDLEYDDGVLKVVLPKRGADATVFAFKKKTQKLFCGNGRFSGSS